MSISKEEMLEIVKKEDRKNRVIGQRSLNLKSTSENIQMQTEFLQPWSTFVMKTQLPSEILEKMIKITDEIIADPDSIRFGYKLSSQIKNEFEITPEIIEREGMMDFFNEVCKHFIIQSYCQSNPFAKEKYIKETWLVRQTAMWAVSQYDHEYNGIHAHGNAEISAVMYLKIPEYVRSRKFSRVDMEKVVETESLTDVEDTMNSHNDDGAITFTGSTGKSMVWGESHMTFQPQVGDFLIFPADQKHLVYPFRTADGKSERRSVSFNAIFSSKSAEIKRQELMEEERKERELRNNVAMKLDREPGGKYITGTVGNVND